PTRPEVPESSRSCSRHPPPIVPQMLAGKQVSIALGSGCVSRCDPLATASGTGSSVKQSALPRKESAQKNSGSKRPDLFFHSLTLTAARRAYDALHVAEVAFEGAASGGRQLVLGLGHAPVEILI